MVSIILPWVRKDGYTRCVDAVMRSVNPTTKFEIVAEEDVDHVGCNPMVNKLVERAKYPIVCFLHDDSVPQKGFLEEALNEMAKFDGGWGCVGFNDMIHKADGPCTHWMIHKNMLKYFPDGVFYSEQYIHTRVDFELKQVSLAAKRYRWAKNAKIRHLNPIYTASVKRDDVSKRCYDSQALAHDLKTYSRRRQEQGNVWKPVKNPMEIPIEKIFDRRDDYIIIKMSELFPFFKRGADIDIACRDKERFAKHIQSHIKGYDVRVKKKLNHIYVDVCKGRFLILRFDLIQSLKEYNLDIAKMFKERRKRIENGKPYWVPSKKDELQIRRCEYTKNPKKTWHRDYIKKYAPGLLFNLEPRVKV